MEETLDKLEIKPSHPLTISEGGMQFVKRLHIDKMFENNWDRTKQMLDGNVKGKNPYDINEYCIKYAMVYPERFLQDNEIDLLKRDAYNKGMLLADYMKIMAVMARDRYFKENNISTEV